MFGEYICSVRDRKVRGSKHLSRNQSSPVLKCITYCDRRAKKFEVLKCLVNIFVLFLIKECVVQSILREANLHLAVKLQSDLIIRAIL